MVYRQPTGQSVQDRDHRPRPLRARAATTGSAQQVRPEREARAGHVARPGGPRGSPRPGRRPRPQREEARPSVPGAQRSQAARAVLPARRPADRSHFLRRWLRARPPPDPEVQRTLLQLPGSKTRGNVTGLPGPCWTLLSPHLFSCPPFIKSRVCVKNLLLLTSLPNIFFHSPFVA